MIVEDGGKRYNAVIVGSANVNPGYKLVSNAAYPNIAQDYERTFRVLKSLPCDLFLGAHGAYFDLDAKYPRMKTAGVAAFLDPDGYKAFVADRETAFQKELANQRAARHVS
jgi:metallo-beta-lactamase class B